jgi:hypothetical protein
MYAIGKLPAGVNRLQKYFLNWFKEVTCPFGHFRSEKLESKLIIFKISVDLSVRPSVCILAKTLMTTT